MTAISPAAGISRLFGQSRTLAMRGVAYFAIAAIAATPQRAYAHAAEIQVYDGEIAAPGTFNATLHANYIPKGQGASRHPEGFATGGALTLGPEFAYGVNDRIEFGALVPIATVAGGSWQFDGLEFRALFTVPHAAERSFFYGMNFAFVINEPAWRPERFTAEIRPIAGWHLGAFDLIFNPILETSFDGFKKTEFAPVARIAHALSPKWTLAVEHHTGIGPFARFTPRRERPEQLFLVTDFAGESFEVELGAGFGLTPASDNLVFKLILSRDLN